MFETFLQFSEVVVLPLALALAYCFREMARLSGRLASVETWREEHGTADRDEHKRIADGLDAITSEIRLSRQENTENLNAAREESSHQHAELRRVVDENAQEARKGRSDIHERVNDIGNSVARLEGIREALGAIKGE